jgi:K+-transporting ATPase c subunit
MNTYLEKAKTFLWQGKRKYITTAVVLIIVAGFTFPVTVTSCTNVAFLTTKSEAF